MRADQNPGAQAPALRGKAATQERILRAASDLFLKRGYEHTTIAQIAERASVSRATIFWHFSDKAGLFREVFSRLLIPFQEGLESSLRHLDAGKRLSEQFAVYDSFVNGNRVVIEGFVRWAIESPEFRTSLIRVLMELHERFRCILRETLTELMPPSQNADAVASGLSALLDGNLLLSLFDPSEPGDQQRRAGAEALAALIPRRGPAAGEPAPRPAWRKSSPRPG